MNRYCILVALTPSHRISMVVYAFGNTAEGLRDLRLAIVEDDGKVRPGCPVAIAPQALLVAIDLQHDLDVESAQALLHAWQTPGTGPGMFRPPSQGQAPS